MKKEQAYKILGLDSSASNAQIKRKYANCARRAKFDSSYDFEAATEAFDTLLGYSWGKLNDDSWQAEKGKNKKKVESFFYLHTRALIYSIFVFIVLFGSILLFIMTKVNYDFKITVIGSSIVDNLDEMETYYERLIGVDKVLCTSYPIGNYSDQEISEAGYLHLFQDIAGGESDIFILHMDIIKMLSSEGALQDLSPYISELGLTEGNPNIFWWFGEGDNNIAAAYYFEESDILDIGFKGEIPGFFSVPIGRDINDNTITVMMDLINNGN